MSKSKRLYQFILAMSMVTLCYYLSGQAQLWLELTPTLIAPTWLDNHIAFNPVGSWVYVSFWLLILITFLTATPSKVYALTRLMVVCAIVSAIIYIAYPTKVYHANMTPDSSLHKTLWALIHHIDTHLAQSQNCLPSLHVTITVLCVWAMYDKRRWTRWAVWLFWGGWIVFSVLQTKRHLVLDVGAGAVLVLVVLVCYAHLKSINFKHKMKC